MSSQIHALYGKIGCDHTAVQDILGTPDVNNKNVNIYLGFIEERVTTLLLAQYKIEEKVTKLF